MIQNKTAKLISLTTATVLIALVLASSLYYSGNNITANVVAEDPSNFIQPLIKEIDNFNELKYLNEGWYEIRNGYVFYIENFDSYVPLYIKVNNPSNLNGLLVVDADGNIAFDSNKWNLPEKYETQEFDSGNLITGEVTGMEELTGRQTQAQPAPLPNCCPPVVILQSGYRFYYIEGTSEYMGFDENSGQFGYVKATYNGPNRRLDITESYGKYSYAVGTHFTINEIRALSATEVLPVGTENWIQMPGNQNNYLRLTNTGTIRAVYNPAEKTLTPYGATGSESVGNKINIPLTNQQLQTATTFNQNQAYNSQREQFKQYLIINKDLTAEEADEVLNDPQEIAVYQRGLGFTGNDIDGQVGPTTSTKIRPFLPRTATSIPSSSGTSNLQTVDEINAYVLEQANNDQAFLDKVKAVADARGVSYEALLRIMDFESAGTFNPAQPNLRNPNGAIGLIQFTQPAIDDINSKFGTRYTKESLSRMSRTTDSREDATRQ